MTHVIDIDNTILFNDQGSNVDWDTCPLHTVLQTEWTLCERLHKYLQQVDVNNIYYLTGRHHRWYDFTMLQLRYFGFPLDDEAHLYHERTNNETPKGYKQHVIQTFFGDSPFIWFDDEAVPFTQHELVYQPAIYQPRKTTLE